MALTFLPRDAVFGIPPWRYNPAYAGIAPTMNAADQNLRGVVVGPTGQVVQYVWEGDVLDPDVLALSPPDAALVKEQPQQGGPLEPAPVAAAPQVAKRTWGRNRIPPANG